MKENRGIFCRDFSVNIDGYCLPKNCIYGKTCGYYWYFTDYSHIYYNSVEIFARDVKKGGKWKKTTISTNGLLFMMFIYPIIKHHNLDSTTKVEYVLKMKQISKPELGGYKPITGRGRRTKVRLTLK